MTFFDRITGNDIKREFNDFEIRVKKLSLDYQKLWEEIKNNLWNHSNFTGRNLMPVLGEAVVILEEGFISGKSAEQFLGRNTEEFCIELLGEEGLNSYRDKWRKELNNNIYKKLKVKE